MNRDQELIGSVEAAGVIGRDRATVTRWVERGWLIPAGRWPHAPNGAYQFRRSDVEAAARKHGTPALGAAPAGAA